MIPDAECVKLVAEILSQLDIGDFVIKVSNQYEVIPIAALKVPEFLVSWEKYVGRSYCHSPRVGIDITLAETLTFLASSLKPLNRIKQNLTGSKILTSSTKFVFFGLIVKTR